MQAVITFVTACAPYHHDLVQRAAASVTAQTIPCRHIIEYDTERRGAGAARNQALTRVNTPYVVFLDADDWVLPDFAEQTLNAHRATSGQYIIYTDWQTEDGALVCAPDCAWTAPPGAQAIPFHCITALVPTAWIRAVGGFDEALTGGEDTDIWLKLAAAGRCGRRLAAPLFVYGKSGQRSRAWLNTDEYHAAQVRWTQTYGGVIMGCCGDDAAPPTVMMGRQPNDVLVRPRWLGKRRYVGASGRDYGRIDGSRLHYMDPRDATPQKGFEIIDRGAEMPPPISPPSASEPVTDTDATLIHLGMSMGLRPPPVAQQAAPFTPANENGYGDVRQVLKLATPVKRRGRTVPTFVFSDTDYPSYADLRTLVSLSEFDAVTLSRADFSHPDDVYILVTPEQPPDLNAVPARVILWNFEYAGDYVPKLETWKRELWASDPAWAQARDAQFVLCGSDSRLQMCSDVGMTDEDLVLGYDVTMLGYMTPRRVNVKRALPTLTWTPDYPGTGIERDAVLKATRLMLNVCQHDERYLTPLRLAVAAAYKLPVIHETVANTGPYADAVEFCDYDAITDAALAFFKKKRKPALGERLYKLLCEKYPFRASVLNALEADRRAAI